MGLFSSSTKTYVGTTIARVLADDAIVPSTKTAVVKAIMQGGAVSEYVLEDLVAGMGTKGKRFFNYGRDHYLYGLPSGKLNTPTQGSSEVQVILNALEGGTVVLAYNFYGDINYSHLGWKALSLAYTVNPFTDELIELSAAKGTTVRLDYLTLVLNQATFDSTPAAMLTMWGNDCRLRFDETSVPGSVGVEATYYWKEEVFHMGGNEGNGPYYSLDDFSQTDLIDAALSVVGYDPEQEYFQVRYAFDGHTRFWEYQIGTGTYLTLDNLFNVPLLSAGTYFPFGYFRYNKVSMADPSEAVGYASSKKLMKKLGLDYDQLLDAIHENPDIDDVEQAMLFMAVPAGSVHPIEQEYLYRYFDQMFYATGGQVTSLSIADMATDFPAELRKETATVVQDARFKLSLSNLGMVRRTVTGSIGPVGSYASSSAITGYPVTYNAGGDAGVAVTLIRPIYNHLYRKQVSLTQYDELQVMDLISSYHIWGAYKTVGTGGNNADRLLIPLDLLVMADMSLPEKEALYSRAMHYVFNSRVEVKVAWYASEFFQFVLLVVSIAMVLNGIPANFAAAVAGNSLFVNFVMLSFYAGVALIKMLIVKLFIKAVGVEAAFIAAIIAAMMGMYQAFQSGSLAGAPWAKDLLALANGLNKGIQQSLSKSMAGLQDEAREFTSWMDEQTKLLDTANELLENQNVLSPFVIFGEKPDEFFNRTVHSGNIGLTSIEALSSYVQLALTLPKLNETLQGEFNGDSTV